MSYANHRARPNIDIIDEAIRTRVAVGFDAETKDAIIAYAYAFHASRLQSPNVIQLNGRTLDTSAAGRIKLRGDVFWRIGSEDSGRVITAIQRIVNNVMRKGEVGVIEM